MPGYENRSLIALLACLALAAGCGADADEPAVDFTVFSQAMRAISVRTCRKAHLCRDSYPYDLVHPFAAAFGDTPQECEDEHTISDERLALLETSLAAGRIRYDPALAADCHAALWAAECRSFWQEAGGAACADMVRGTLEPGAACRDNWECLSESCSRAEGKCQIE